MPPLRAPALHSLATHVQTLLLPTAYAFQSFTQLPGGTTSYVFLATLTTPLTRISSSGALRTEEVVIIKHATAFASCHTDFLVDAERLKYEAAMLTALRGFKPGGEASGMEVALPELYFFAEEPRVMVMQYIPATTPLQKGLHGLSSFEAERVGRGLGMWLGAFHKWCEETEQGALREVLDGNREEVELKWKLMWGQGTEVLDRMRNAVGKAERTAWDAAMAKALEEKGKAGQVVHGDFWAGNILIPTTSPFPSSFSLHIIDLEFAHLSSLATDLGQFLGSLLEFYYVSPDPPSATLPLITAFLAGYGSLSEDTKWQTAMYVGVHVVNWWSRGPPGRKDMDEGTRRRGVELLEKGLRWVKAAWEKDRTVFPGEGEMLGVHFV